MSNSFDCSTPMSTVHLETNDSDDVSDYFSSIFYDKHSDSIISTTKALEIQSKKSKSRAPGLVDVSSLKSTFTEKLKKIQQNFHSNVQIFTKIYENRPNFTIKTPEKHKNQKTRENQIQRPLISKEEAEIREKISILNLNRINLIKKKYEDHKNQIIDQKRDDLQKVWRGKMFELNGRLQQAEWKKSSENREEKERIRSLFEDAYKAALSKERVLLEKDIDEHYAEQFAEKRKRVKSRAGLADVRSKLQGEQSKRLLASQQQWRLEGLQPELKLKAQLALENEQDLLLHQARLRAKDSSTQSSSQRLELFKLNLNLQLQSSKKPPNALPPQVPDPLTLQLWQEEAQRELKQDQATELSSQYKSALTPALIKEVTRTLSLSIENKVFKNEQMKIFSEVSEELTTTFEFFKRETESLLKRESLQIEQDFASELKNLVLAKANAKLVLKEKELHMKYVKSYEKVKEGLKKETEEKFLVEVKRKRESVARERTALAQMKAKGNVQVSRIEEMIADECGRMEQDRARVVCRLREIQFASKAEDDMVFKAEDVITKSTSRHNYSSMIPTDHSKDQAAFTIPPSLSVKEIRARNGSNLISPRTAIEPSPRELKPAQLPHPAHTRQGKDLAISQSLSFDCLKLRSKDKLRNSLVKQSMYHELLKEKFGFIKPRLK